VIIERLAPDADVGPIVEIEHSSFSTPWTADMFRWELRNTDVSSTWVVRTSEGRIIAFCCAWVVLDELHINNVAVTPEFRGQGVAAELLGYVIDDAMRQGATRATLEVRRSNAAALKLYQKLGFTQGGVRQNYYSNPVEDALILWRGLVDPSDTLTDPGT
jgi:[ribosomal protein S18]-alanine N-acetyltransferase